MKKPQVQSHRAVGDLLLAFAATTALLLLSAAINFRDEVHDFFAPQTQYLSPLLANLLFVWFAVMMLMAFWRWRRAARRNAELESVISSISPDTLVVVDRDRIIHYCNASGKRMFGYEPDELIGRQTDLLYSDRRSDKKQVHEIYDALNRDGFHIGLAMGWRKDGRELHLEIISAELQDRDGAVLLIRDISERVAAEQERNRMTICMQQHEKLESLGLLAGGIAHDFNNLLNTILITGELVAKQLKPDDPTRQLLAELQNAGAMAVKLCRQLMVYADGSRVQVGSVNLSAIAREMTHLLGMNAAKEIERRLELDDDMPPIMADATQMRQVVLNLLTNAADAMGERAGRITVATGVRDCDAAYLADCGFGHVLPAGSYAFISVADTGIGMAASVRERVFDPFFTTKSTGHGLGLASVQRIIMAHNGGIKVQSELGKGTVFTALLPLNEMARTRDLSSTSGGE